LSTLDESGLHRRAQALSISNKLLLSTLDESGLRRRAQALTISNELLRNDISALNADRVSLSQSVNTLKHRLENSDADLRAEVARLTAEKATAAAELQKSADRLQETEQRLQDSQLLLQNMSRNMQQGEDSLKTQEEQAAVIGQLQRKNNQLEEDLLRSYQQHKEELTRVTLDRDRYRGHLEQSQVEMLQLEEDLQVYIDLFQEMETGKTLNNDNAKLNQEHAEQIQEMFSKAEKERESLLQERGELEQLDEREKAMTAENKKLKFAAEDAERKESQTNEDLFSAMMQVSDLSADVALLTVAEEECQAKLQESASRCDELQSELQEKRAELELEGKALWGRLKESESKLSKMNEQLDAEFERFGMEMEATSNDLQAANQERAQLRNDLENCLSIIEENERASEAQYHEQLAFHEAERNTQVESLRETEEALSRETEKAQKLQTECEERQEALGTLQGDFKELKARLTETLQELDSIKTSAHHMLLQQGQEMQATRELLGAVRGRLEGLACSLQDRIGNGKQAEPVSMAMPAVTMATPARSAPGNGSLVTPAKAVSLVSSIMYAVRETVMGTPIDQSESTSEEEPGTEKEPDQSEQSLVVQTEAVSDLVTRVLGMMKMLEKASDLALSDLQTENLTLKRKLGRIHQDHDDAIHDVTSDLMQSEQREEKLRVELNLKREELTAVQQALEYSKEKLTQLSENMGCLSDAQQTCKKQTAELEKLGAALRSREEENRLLKEELGSALGQRSCPNGGQRSEATLVKERISLKAEVSDLRLKLMDKEEEMTQVLATANRRMKAHEDNQQKAETEVCRLDNIIEVIRKTLHKHKDIVGTCDELTELLKDLDGDENSEDTIHFSHQLTRTEQTSLFPTLFDSRPSFKSPSKTQDASETTQAASRSLVEANLLKRARFLLKCFPGGFVKDFTCHTHVFHAPRRLHTCVSVSATISRCLLQLETFGLCLETLEADPSRETCWFRFGCLQRAAGDLVTLKFRLDYASPPGAALVRQLKTTAAFMSSQFLSAADDTLHPAVLDMPGNHDNRRTAPGQVHCRYLETLQLGTRRGPHLKNTYRVEHAYLVPDCCYLMRGPGRRLATVTTVTPPSVATLLQGQTIVFGGGVNQSYPMFPVRSMREGHPQSDRKPWREFRLPSLESANTDPQPYNLPFTLQAEACQLSVGYTGLTAQFLSTPVFPGEWYDPDRWQASAAGLRVTGSESGTHRTRPGPGNWVSLQAPASRSLVEATQNPNLCLETNQVLPCAPPRGEWTGPFMTSYADDSLSGWLVGRKKSVQSVHFGDTRDLPRRTLYQPPVACIAVFVPALGTITTPLGSRISTGRPRLLPRRYPHFVPEGFSSTTR
ncbi:antigen 5, partial [Branchiostoma belcheri]